MNKFTKLALTARLYETSGIPIHYDQLPKTFTHYRWVFVTYVIEGKKVNGMFIEQEKLGIVMQVLSQTNEQDEQRA